MNKSHSNGEPNPDQRARMVDDALASMKHKFKPINKTVAEDIMLRAKVVTQTVAKTCREFTDPARKAGIVTHDTKLLSALISKEYAELFSQWSKDELLFLITLIHTEQAIEQISGETNTGGNIII